MEKRLLIFDCDPGIDDAFAIAYLKKCDFFDVKMVSSVAGNVELKYTTRNLRGLVKALDWDVEVCEGAEKPIIGKQIVASEVHGNNGLSGYEFKEDELAPLSTRPAYEAMVDILEKADKKVTIIAVGPLTNVAILLLGRPDLADKIEEIGIMGGGLKGGNTTPAAEFNILADAEAAQVVFNSGIKIRMAGLDITERARFTKEEDKLLQESDEKINKILSAIVQKPLKFERFDGGSYSNMHDTAAIMAFVHPEVFETEDLYVQVETEGRIARGMTIADQRQVGRIEPNTAVLVDIDMERFTKTMIGTLVKK